MANPAIPASDLVGVTPGVIGPGGTAESLIAILLTTSTRIPIGTVRGFLSQSSVANFFGAASAEAAWATVYFAGFDSSSVKPASLLMTQYPTAALGVPAYLRGGSVAGLSLTQLQAISGTLNVTINGVVKTGSINLSAATSFSLAATSIQTSLAAYDAAGTGSITGTLMTIASGVTGTFAVGQVVSGVGVTVGTTITVLGTGTGGTGTYTVTPSQTASSTTISAGPAVVTYDSTSGAFIITGGTPGVTSTIGFGSGAAAIPLLFTAATGAVISQGAAVATPAAFMAGVITQSTTWFTLNTLFEPSTNDGVAFAGWVSGQNNRYAFIGFDTDILATESGQTTTLGYLVQAANDSGTVLLYEPSNLHQEAFVSGLFASIDYTARNGRVNPTFKSQSGITPGVSDFATATQLRLNGYNFYGVWATATQQFQGLNPGSITGPFAWMDSYADQRWLNDQLQGSIISLLFNANFIPYNAAGSVMIKAACNDPIQAAIFNGIIQSGVVLSATQIAEVNAAAGLPIDQTLFQQGWYLQVGQASPTVRNARGSPPCTFWYTTGGSVQQINLFSEEVS